MILVILDLHVVRVEIDQFCKKQSCRELNSLQDGAISKTICRTLNPLAAEFFYTLQGHGDNFLQTFTWHRIFSMFTVWNRLFSLVLMFSGLRIEALPLSTVLSKCIYTFFKAENQEIQFPFLCTKPLTT